MRLVLAFLLVVAPTAPAGAVSLIGDFVGCEGSGTLACAEATSEVVEAASEFAVGAGGAPVLTVDVSETAIRLEGAGSSGPLASGDGLTLTGLDGADAETEALLGCGPFFVGSLVCEGAGGVLGLPELGGVRVVDGGAGLTSSQVAVTSVTALAIDLAGTTWSEGASATLELEYVPEPAAGLLALAGLAGLAAARRKR